jgi:hypothetical protein
MQACLDGDRASIGHTKLGPTLAIKDVHPTIIIADIHPTSAIADAPHPTVAVLDVHPTLVNQDVHPTIATVDVHPTIQVVDIHTTIAVLDHGPTNALLDHGIPNPQFPPPGPGPEAMPFVLATPHHTMAWTRSFPDMAQSRAASLLSQIAQHEQTLQQLGDAEAAGALSAYDSVAAEQVNREYDRLVAEYRQLVGG